MNKVGDTTTNIQTNNNILVGMVFFEDLSHLTDNVKTQLLSVPFAMIPKLIKAVHFNDEKPENKNIVLQIKKII